MLTTKVKASHITNLTDARYFSAMGVDWLGFSLDPVEANHVPPKKMQEMTSWLEGPAIVGEFTMAQAATIRESYDLLDLDFVQLGAFHQLDDAKALTGIPTIKEIIVEKREDILQLNQQLINFLPYVALFLIDLSKNSLTLDNEVELLSHLKKTCKGFPILFQLNSGVQSIHTFIETVEPLGISVVGGEEEAVGVKSFDELDELFELLLIEQ